MSNLGNPSAKIRKPARRAKASLEPWTWRCTAVFHDMARSKHLHPGRQKSPRWWAHGGDLQAVGRLSVLSVPEKIPSAKLCKLQRNSVEALSPNRRWCSQDLVLARHVESRLGYAFQTLLRSICGIALQSRSLGPCALSDPQIPETIVVSCRCSCCGLMDLQGRLWRGFPIPSTFL